MGDADLHAPTEPAGIFTAGRERTIDLERVPQPDGINEPEMESTMTAVTSLLLVILALGFAAVGLQGFLGWRARMRDGVVDNSLTSKTI